MRISLKRVTERFLSYTTYDTQSAEGKDGICPSTEGQRIFASALLKELEELGLTETVLDDNGYLMATLPSNLDEKLPTIGFLAHMDTSPDASGRDIRARIVERYDGGDIVLNKEENIILSPREFPELLDYIDEPICVTDGRTLLGADDKAGIAAILTAVEYLLEHKEIPHGKIRIAFTPDEEVGHGADHFDLEKFAADFAYTVDGGALGALEYENFHAANAHVEFFGKNIHTGYAKNRMINALTLAAEWQMMLPQAECPECTEGYEGFFHVHRLEGNVDYASMMMLIRDHDRLTFEERKNYLEKMVELMLLRHGKGTVSLDSYDIYHNMYEVLQEREEIIQLAEDAMRSIGIDPMIEPVRGGTDGARLSFMGLPCPNIFTGGANFHGKYEYLPLHSLQKSSETVLEIICRAGRNGLQEIRCKSEKE